MSAQTDPTPLQALAAEMDGFLATHADAAQAARYAKYFREGYDACGVPDDVLRPQRDAWLAAYRQALGLAGFLDLGDILISGGKYEAGWLAIGFAGAFRKELRVEHFERLGRWLDIGIANWAHSDTLCGDLLSYFYARNMLPLAAMAGWRAAPSKWKRRAVPVTMLELLKKPGRYEPLLEFVRPMMLDEERVVHQGLGWFLREAWKKQAPPVEAFLLGFRETAPRLIFQYATEKMTPEQRERFRRTRKEKEKT